MSKPTGDYGHPSKRFKLDSLPLQPARAVRMPNVFNPRGRKQNEIESLANYEIKGKSITSLVDQMVENSDDVDQGRLVTREVVNQELNELEIRQGRDHERLQEMINNFHAVDKKWGKTSNKLDDSTSLVFKDFCSTVLHRLEDENVDGITLPDITLIKANQRIQDLEAEIASIAIVSVEANEAALTERKTIDSLTVQLNEALSNIERANIKREQQESKISDQAAKINGLEVVIRTLNEDAVADAKDHFTKVKGLHRKEKEITNLREQLHISQEDLVTAEMKTVKIQSQLKDESLHQNEKFDGLKATHD